MMCNCWCVLLLGNDDRRNRSIWEIVFVRLFVFMVFLKEVIEFVDLEFVVIDLIMDVIEVFYYVFSGYKFNFKRKEMCI